MAPAHEIAHVGPVELLTPEPERSRWFFTRVMALTENGTDGDSVYLRTWDDYQHHTVKPTAHHTSGIRRTSLRASGPEALDRRVRAIDEAGLGLERGGTRQGPGMEPADHRVLPHPRHPACRLVQ